MAETVAAAPGVDRVPRLRGWPALEGRADAGEPATDGLGRASQSARERLLGRLAWREKRRSRWEASRELWEAAARGARVFGARPWEEMAKIHEHRLRDFIAAKAVVQEALERALAHRAPAVVVDALHHRLARLTRRLAPAL